MSIITDYKIVTDKHFTLEIGGDIDWDKDFGLPSNAREDQGGVLLFRVEALSPKNLKFRVNFNGRENHKIVLNDNDHHLSFHEAITGIKTGNNNLAFTVESGEGTLNVSDIVLYFKRNA